MIQALLRGYSVLFHVLLCLFCLAVATVSWLADSSNLTIDVLPWTGTELRTWLFVLSFLGLVATLLAATGKLRILFLPWTIAVVFLLGRGLFSTRYYAGVDDLKYSLLFLLGALATVLGAISFIRKAAPQRR